MEPRSTVYTIKEVAAVLKCTEPTVRQAIRLGQLPVREISHTVRIPASALWRWLRDAEPKHADGSPISTWPDR